MRSLFSRFAKPARHRGVRRREVFSAQFDGGQSAAAYGTSTSGSGLRTPMDDCAHA